MTSILYLPRGVVRGNAGRDVGVKLEGGVEAKRVYVFSKEYPVNKEYFEIRNQKNEPFEIVVDKGSGAVDLLGVSCQRLVSTSMPKPLAQSSSEVVSVRNLSSVSLERGRVIAQGPGFEEGLVQKFVFEKGLRFCDPTSCPPCCVRAKAEWAPCPRFERGVRGFLNRHDIVVE